MALIILGGLGFYGYNVLINKGYKQGVNDAIISINQQLINELNQQGFIYINYPLNETSSIQIKLVPQLDGNTN